MGDKRICKTGIQHCFCEEKYMPECCYCNVVSSSETENTKTFYMGHEEKRLLIEDMAKQNGKNCTNGGDHAYIVYTEPPSCGYCGKEKPA